MAKPGPKPKKAEEVEAPKVEPTKTEEKAKEVKATFESFKATCQGHKILIIDETETEYIDSNGVGYSKDSVEIA